MVPIDPPSGVPPAHVLTDAPTPPAGSRSPPFLLLNATLACTLFALVCAFNFISAYVHNIGSKCGTPQATAESAVWLFAGAAVVESLFARSFARHARLPAGAIRLVSLCLLANVLSLLTPTLLEFRAEHWPH